MENRIKEQQLDLFADRTSTQTFQSNQLRLWFSSITYVLMQDFRHHCFAKTSFASEIFSQHNNYQISPKNLRKI